MNYKTQKCILCWKKISQRFIKSYILQQKHNVLKAFSKQGKNKLLFLNNIEKLDSNLLIKVKSKNSQSKAP